MVVKIQAEHQRCRLRMHSSRKITWVVCCAVVHFGRSSPGSPGANIITADRVVQAVVCFSDYIRVIWNRCWAIKDILLRGADVARVGPVGGLGPCRSNPGAAKLLRAFFFFGVTCRPRHLEPDGAWRDTACRLPASQKTPARLDTLQQHAVSRLGAALHILAANPICLLLNTPNPSYLTKGTRHLD